MATIDRFTARFGADLDWAPTLSPMDNIPGTSGDDVLNDTPGGDFIDALGGNDQVTVTGGIDTVAGGSGDDRLIIDYRASGSAVANDSGPNANGGLGGFDGTFSNFVNRSVSYSSIEHFTISTGSGNDSITTATGNDVVSTGAGNDGVNVGTGTDQADGGDGEDGISADMSGASAAILWNLEASYSGPAGSSFTNFEYFGTVSTGSGNDVVVTRDIARGETINLGGGNDSVTVRHGIDTVTGGSGDDRLIIDYRTSGNSVSNSSGPNANGVLGGFDGAFSNFVNRSVSYTSIEHFTITGGSGSDTITTASGDDVYRQIGEDNPNYLRDVIDLGAGNDRLVVDLSAGTVGALVVDPAANGSGEITFSGFGKLGFSNVESFTAIGTRLGDTLRGRDGDDVFEGRTGNDVIETRGGNDILNGGLGADTMTGGTGNDTYYVNEAGDQTIEASNEGIDTVLTSELSHTLAANIENLASALPERPYVVSAESPINEVIVANTQHPRGVTVLNDGGYVVTWQDVNNGTDVRARVFNADGTPRGAEFTVHESTVGNQGQFGIGAVALANGGFLVGYYETLVGPNEERISGRVYDANGVAQGASYTLTDTTGTFDSFPAMARLNDGRIALLSQNGGAQDTNGTFGIRYTLLNADGSVGAGAPTIFQTTVAGDQIGPSVAKLDDGRLIVVWESGEPGGKVFRGRFIDANGAPSGNDFLISNPGGESPDSGEVRAQVTALNGGGFAVAWGITNEIVGRVFNSAGQPVGAEFTLNQRPAGAQTTVAITRLAEGGFMAAWTSDQGEDGDAQSVVGRLFNADGSARGEDFVINQTGTRFQLFPEMTTLQDGRVVVVFSSDVPGSGSNYEGKQIILDTTPNQTLTGNALGNRITAGSTNDALNGLDGDDQLEGGGGTDVLNGGLGNDGLDGGAGADQMSGGADNDVYVVDNGGDQATELSGEGNDRVYASVNYTLAGGSEIELLIAANLAGTGALDFTGNEFGQIVIGNDGVNALNGLGGNDTLYGLGGNDVLDGGTGADAMFGGAGDDTYRIDDLGDQAIEAAGEGNDTVLTSISFALGVGRRIEQFATTDAAGTGAIDLIGNDVSQIITGNAGVNNLYGLAGNDTLNGLGGNDSLDGGTGADSMSGGTGDDIYAVDDALDQALEAVGEGNDRVLTTVDYQLNSGREIELLAAYDLGGTGALNLTGNAFGQTIIGNDGVNGLAGLAGDDTLFGLGGSDVLDGGTGNDYLIGGAGADLLVFSTALGEGNLDQIIGFTSGTDGIALSSSVFAGLSAGALPAGAFVAGTAAQDADDRIVYDQATGALYFDADGNGAGAAVQFANLTPGTALVASDFSVI